MASAEQFMLDTKAAGGDVGENFPQIPLEPETKLGSTGSSPLEENGDAGNAVLAMSTNCPSTANPESSTPLKSRGSLGSLASWGDDGNEEDPFNLDDQQLDPSAATIVTPSSLAEALEQAASSTVGLCQSVKRWELLSQGQAFSDLGAALENAVLKDACPALCGIGATDTLGRLSDARRKSREVSSTSSLVMKQLWAFHTHASLLESGAEAALAEAQATWKVLSDTKTKFREMAQGQVYGPFSETILDIVRPAEERLEMLALGPLTTMVAAVRELCSPSLASALDGQRRKLLVLLEGLIGAKEVSKLDISDIRESSTVYKIDSVINNPIDSKTGVNSHRNRSVIGTRSGSIRGSSSSVDMTEGATSSSSSVDMTE